MLIKPAWKNMWITHWPFRYLTYTITKHVLLSNGHIAIWFVFTCHILNNLFSFLVRFSDFNTCVLAFDAEKVSHDGILGRKFTDARDEIVSIIAWSLVTWNITIIASALVDRRFLDWACLIINLNNTIAITFLIYSIEIPLHDAPCFFKVKLFLKAMRWNWNFF